MAKQDDSDLDGELHSKFLMSAADVTRTLPAPLRCHLDLLSVAILNKYNYALSTVAKKKTTACQYCFTSWKSGDFNLRIKPKARLGKKMRKILKKQKNNEVLSPIQKKLAQLHRGNTVVIKCRICEKHTRLKTFRKPEVQKAVEMNGESVAVDKPARTRKKKSAGEERKTCGLNPEVILKLNPLCKKIEDEWNKIDRREIFVGPIDFSLKRGSKNSSENREGGAGKSGTEQEQRISTKANPAPKSSQKASKQKNIKTFDPFSKCFNSPKRNQRILAPIRLRKKKSGGLRKKLLNPYSKEAINQSQKTGKKKLDRLKKLVSAEEQTPAHSTSLRDYCREYLDKPRFQSQVGTSQMQPQAAHQMPRKRGYIEPVPLYQYIPLFPDRISNYQRNNPYSTFAHKSLY